MDAAGLTVLLAELHADCSVAADAGRKAGQRLRDPGPGHLEACVQARLERPRARQREETGRSPRAKID